MRFLSYISIITLLIVPNALFGQAPDLGAASTFALFTAAGSFNGDPGSSITGDIGTNVGAFTPPGFLVGNIHVSDPVTAQAAADVSTAYGFLGGLTCGVVLATPFGNNLTLTPNIYCIGSAAVLNANLTLDGGGNPGAIFIFKINGALSTNPSSNIILTNGASLCNVYWQVNGAFNHDGTTFQGTVIAAGALNFGFGAQFTGRGLSTEGAISTANNNVTLPNACLCELDVTCPNPVGGTFECPGNIPVGVPANVTVISACGTPTIIISETSTGTGCVAAPYILTRSYTVSDQGGHTTTCTVTFTAIDQTVPTITCPAGLAVSCSNNVPAAATTSVITADNCGGTVSVVSLGDVITNLICPNRFTLTRTYRSSDQCSNTATCSQTITVNDVIAPSITCPANLSVSCASAVPPIATGSVTTSDLCGGTVSVVHLGDITTPGTCANRFSIARTYQASDLCGNSGTCAQTITVNDITPPSIICPVSSVVDCASNVPPPVAIGSIIASDLCGGAVTVLLLGNITTPGTCANRFSIARTYQATDLCGNSGTCAQIITVNDITPPGITCPANVIVSCASAVPPATIGSVITSDLCGGTVSVGHLGDITTPGTCANRFSIARTYQASDVCGNSSTCTQIITVNDLTKPIFTNVPANLTVECFLVPPIPQNLTATDNCTGSATITFLGEIQTAGICPIIYTLTRTWRADDGCGNSSTVSQLVQVQDTYAPQFVIIPANVVRECNQVTNLTDLQAWLDSHGGATVSDCSSITWTYQNSPFNLDTAGCGSTFRKYIRFIATDACGNSSFKDARFTVVDQTPPIFTILPQNLNIACWMGENGEPQLLDWLDHFGFAAVSDCGAVKTEIGLLSEVFGCSGTFTRIYQFRATDECGNTSYVTATFAIVDTTPPLITSCPQSNVLLTCESDIPGPDMAGVMAMDMCSDVTVTLQSTTINGIGCAYSPLTKTYTYAFTDGCGNVSTCTQSFVVIDTIQPSYTGPDTLYVLCVADLPGVGDLDDVLAPYFVDNCYKKLCVGELLAGNDLNSVTFNIYFKDLCANWADKDTVTFIANGGCKPLCSAPQDVWGNTGGLINGLGTTALIEQLMNKQGALIAGKLNKTISVTSAACLQNMLPGSGNTNQFSPIHYTFTAANGCNLSSPLLNSDGTLKHKLAANVFAMQLNIWYNAAFNDRNLGVQLLASVPTALVDPIIFTKLEVQHFNVQGLLNLSNDYLAGVGFFPPNFGIPLNSALENLNNYWQNCQTNAPTSGNVSVAGTLKTATLDGLENAQVHFEGLGNGGPLAGAIALSNEAGGYEFSNAVPMFGNYTVTPSSENMAHLNGVSTYDLLLISKHILGITPFDSPYKMIAADVNNSGSITTLDIVEGRKLILGVYEAFPDNTAWRFIDKAFVFPNALNPFSSSFPEYKTLENMQASQMSDDFVGVKIGDVNGSAKANTFMSIPDRNTGTLLFDLEERSVQAGEIFDVTFKSDQIVQGYQFTLHTPGLEVLEVSGNEAVVSNFAVFNADAALTSSWNLPVGATAQAAEFTLKLQATKSGRLSEMLRLSNRITQSEAYRNDNNGSQDPIILNIALRFHDAAGTTISSNGFELYQNIPNPFVDQTTIGFYLPESTEAVLTVYDETGRLIYNQRGDFYKGYNTFSINQSLSNTNGALLYKVATSTDIGIMKMIQTK